MPTPNQKKEYKPDHTSSNALASSATGAWIKAIPERYHPNLIEKIACILGKHYECRLQHEIPQGRHCLKCDKFY